MASGSGKSWIKNVLVLVLLSTSLFGTIFGALNSIVADTTNYSTAVILIMGASGTIIAVGFLYKILDGSGI